MANTIIQIRSSGVTGNVPQSLQPGELAINYVDGKLFYGDSLSQSQLFDVITEPVGLNGELQFNDSGSFGSDSQLSFNTTTKVLTVGSVSTGGLNVAPAIQSAYLHANAAFAAANSGSSSTDSFARNQANSAYNQANTGTVLAQSAYDFANTLSISGGSSIGISDDTTTNSEYYITFTSNTSGIVTSLNTSSSKLGYNPSTGTLSVESVDVTQNTNISSGSTEDLTGSQFIVDSFSVDEIRSAFYQVQIESSSGHQVLSLNVIHDGSTANVSIFGNTFSDSSLGSFTATIVGSALRVLFTSSVGAVVVSFIKSTIRKIAQLFPSGDLGYVGDSATVFYDLGYVGDSATSSADYGGLN